MEQAFGPVGKPVAELVCAEEVVLVTNVVDVKLFVADTELIEELSDEVLDIEVTIDVGVEVVVTAEVVDEKLMEVLVETEEVVAIQLQALLTRLTTFPLHPEMAKAGIAVVAVIEDSVNVPQND